MAKNNKQYQIVYQFVCYGSKEFFFIVVVDFEAANEYAEKNQVWVDLLGQKPPCLNLFSLLRA